MKNFTFLLATILISISAIAAELNGGTKLYLNPGPWDVDGAVFVAYYWGDPNGDQWSDFNDSDNDSIFETTVPNGAWTGLNPVCRTYTATTSIPAPMSSWPISAPASTRRSAI